MEKFSAYANNSFTNADKRKENGEPYIRQVSITEIKVSGQEQYTNGDFIPMFIDVLQGIAKDDKMKPTTLRVLLYILTIVDKNNDVHIDITDISEQIGLGKTSVYKAIGHLITMNVLCHDPNHKTKRKGKFKLNLYVLNPRVAYRGNTRKINKYLAPVILSSDGETPLLPSPNNEFKNTFHEQL